MEWNFGKTNILCLDTAVEEIQNCEQTQEIKLSDGMPDIGRVLGAWGQVILRGKEWRGDSLSLTGGMMVWVLYAPEDGSGEVCLDTWIPFQLKWDLPDGTAEGSIRAKCLTRFVDARSVSARKIMVRAGVGVHISALVPDMAEIYAPEAPMEGVELLRSVYPLRLPVEAGEKTFLQDEDLNFPDSVPLPEKLICYRVEPRVTDRKVLGGKLVFRGITALHVLYRSQEGQLHGWDFEIPFSQYVELEKEYGGDAQGDFLLCVTSLDLELGEEGRLRFKCGIVAQYLITDKEPITLIEDAYSPGRSVELQTKLLEIPVLLENRRETVYPEQSVKGEASSIVDLTFLPDFPRQLPVEGGVDLEMPGSFQLLYYGEDGNLSSGSARWEGKQTLPADEHSRITLLPLPWEAQALSGSSGIQLKAELPLEMTARARQGIPMVTGVTLGDPAPADPMRPSLILRRAGEKRLWEIAKGCGSTVEAIRKANGLAEEPVPGQMLLIPVS